MKRFIYSAAAIATVATGVAFSNDAEAIPAFARQTGQECQACHFQYMPKLTSFGRAFKLGGFTDGDGVGDPIEGDNNLNLPGAMNVAAVVKLQFRMNETKDGDWKMPDEAAIWLAGRVAENWGAAAEIPGEFVSMKFINSNDMGNGNRAGVVVAYTDALGQTFDMELMNTGMVRNIRNIEKHSNIFQETNITQNDAGEETAATMISGFYGNADGLVIKAGLWVPLKGGDAGFDLNQQLRVVQFMDVAGFDTGLGFLYSGGESKAGGSTTILDQSAMAIDFQMQGEVGGHNLGIYGGYSSNDNKGANSKKSGVGVEFAYNVTHATGIRGGFQSITHDMAASSVDGTSLTIGVWHEFAQNVGFYVDNKSSTGDYFLASNGKQVSETRVMLEVAY